MKNFTFAMRFTNNIERTVSTDAETERVAWKFVWDNKLTDEERDNLVEYDLIDEVIAEPKSLRVVAVEEFLTDMWRDPAYQTLSKFDALMGARALLCCLPSDSPVTLSHEYNLLTGAIEQSIAVEFFGVE